MLHRVAAWATLSCPWIVRCFNECGRIYVEGNVRPLFLKVIRYHGVDIACHLQVYNTLHPGGLGRGWERRLGLNIGYYVADMIMVAAC